MNALILTIALIVQTQWPINPLPFADSAPPPVVDNSSAIFQGQP